MEVKTTTTGKFHDKLYYTAIIDDLRLMEIEHSLDKSGENLKSLTIYNIENCHLKC